MARLTSALVALLLCAPAAAPAGDHLLPLADARARLDDHQARRSADEAAVRQVLSSEDAREAARSLGADPDRMARAVATLSDAELRDLAARAQALQADPVAGFDRDVNMLLKIFLLIAIVVLVLQAVD